MIKRKVWRIWIIVPCCIILTLFVFYIGFNYVTNNFHTVIDKKIYRSAQPNYTNLINYQRNYHLKSILNLRGVNLDKSWYQEESLFCKTHSIKCYNISLSAHKTPSIKKIHVLINIIKSSPKPILIHCMGGADRTGLASAMSIILSGNRSLDDMEDQISWQYNVVSPTTIGYQVMNNYLQWLRREHQLYSKQSFLIWAQHPKLINKFGVFLT